MMNWEKYMLTPEKAEKATKQSIILGILSILVSIAGIAYNIYSLKKVERDLNTEEEDDGIEEDLPF